jgi:PAS domain S-box-containing protein
MMTRMLNHGESKLLSRFVALFMILIIAAFIVLQQKSAPLDFAFRFNGYAMITLASMIANAYVLTLVARIKGSVAGLQWFVLFVSSAGVYSISEFFQRLSATPGGGVFWTAISSIGITIIPFSIYFFVADYVGSRNRHTMLLSLFIVCAGLINFLSANGSVLYSDDPGKALLYPWGYNNSTGSGYGVYVLWIAVLSGISLYRLYRFRKRAKQSIIRRQALLFIIAIGVPVSVGVVNDGILPALGHLVLPLAVVAQTTTSILIVYGLRKYRLFVVDPEHLSGNILSSMDEAVVVTRGDYSIELINPKAEQLLQLHTVQLDGHKFSEFFDKESWSAITARKPTEDVRTKILKGLELKGSQGSMTPVRVVSTELRETDELTVRIFVVSDITELAASYQNLELKNLRINSQNKTLTDNKVELSRLLIEAKDLQLQLAREKASVEHTVKVRTRELLQAQAELQAADKLKKEFMILSSHNLRTPLTVFLGGLELIKTTALTAKQSEVIDMIGQSATRLKQFVEDMLTISQLEAGEQLAVQRSSIEKVLEPLFAESLELAKSKKLVFGLELDTGDAMVNCSQLRLQGAFRNILNNAFKFTKEGKVTLSGKIKNGAVVITVTDTGIGIAKNELPLLYDKFHRGTDAMQYDYEGEGIGLYLTKLIIDDHGGTISITSKEHKGTTVSVSLPLGTDK